MAINHLDPYNTGTNYNPNNDPNKPNYVLNKDKTGVVWYDPNNPPNDLPNLNLTTTPSYPSPTTIP